MSLRTYSNSNVASFWSRVFPRQRASLKNLLRHFSLFHGFQEYKSYFSMEQMQVSLFINVVERVSSTLPSVSISKNLCSPLYSLRVGVAQSVQCLGHWLTVRGILVQFPAVKEFISCTKLPDGLRNSLSSLFNEYRLFFPRRSIGRDVKLITHSHLLTRFRDIQSHSVITSREEYFVWL
jgi:hypothetical protein